MQQLINRLRAHADFESVHAVSFLKRAVLSFGEEFRLLQFGVAGVEDDIRREIEDAFQCARRHIQQQTHSAGNAFEIPNVTDGSRQFDVPHAFATDFGASDFDAATVADCPLVTDALVFAAMTFPIARGAEDSFANETVAFGLEGTIIYRLGLFDFAV